MRNVILKLAIPIRNRRMEFHLLQYSYAWELQNTKYKIQWEQICPYKLQKQSME